MKAKVIATGEIVNLIANDYDPVCNENVFKTLDGNDYYYEHEVDFVFPNDESSPIKQIDWGQRRFELAKSALQGLLSNVKYQELSDGYNELAKTKGKTFDETVFYAELACGFADAVITKLKKG